MNRIKRAASPLGVFKSGASLGGKVTQYRDKQKIYSQGDPAFTLFYIQRAECGLPRGRRANPPRSLQSWACMIFLEKFAWRAIRCVCPRRWR